MSERVCPHCQNPIYDEDAVLCHFCGGSLGTVSAGALGRLRGAGIKWIWVTIVLVIAAIVLVQML